MRRLWFWMFSPVGTGKEAGILDECATWSQPGPFLPPGVSRHAHVSGEHFHIKDPPSSHIKGYIFGWRSEGHDGSLSQLPPSSPAADTPSQRQENKPGGAQPFKPAHVWLGGAGDLNRALLHAHIKGVAGCCIDLVTLGSDLPALAIKF